MRAGLGVDLPLKASSAMPKLAIVPIAPPSAADEAE
jgi:hypothetical protein